MYIREVHINGFGIYHDKSITGLTRGVNVLFGLNEKGKSTLLAFIRRCLFGFPKGSTSTNPYPALAGGAYGGRLICSLDNGDELLVARVAGPRGGRVEARYNNRTITDQQELSTLLGNMSQNLYGNVYAIGLTELEQFKSLDSDEIRDRLYGAELGLGRASITETRQKIEAHADALFKQRGSGQVIPKTYSEIEHLHSLIRDFQTELSSYDNHYASRESRQARLNDLDRRIAELTKTQRTLEIQKQLYPEFISYQTAKQKYDAIQDLGQFHESVIKQLNEYKKVITDADNEVGKKTIVVENVKMRLEKFNANDDLIAQEVTINNLSRINDKYQSAANDLPEVKQKRDIKEKSIRDRIAQLGTSLTFESVRGHAITAAQSEQFETLLAGLSDAIDRQTEIGNKLAVHEENAAAKAAPRLEGPRAFRLGVMLIGIISAICLILGIVLTNLWLAGVSMLFGIIAGFLLVGLKWGTPLRNLDPFQRKLLSDREEAEYNLNQLQATWRSFLVNIGLPDSIGPEKAKEMLAEIDHLQSEIDNLDEYNQRIDDMLTTIQEGDAIYSKLLPLFEQQQLSGNILADIPIISSHLEHEKNQRRALEQLTEDLRTKELELKYAAKSADAAREELSNFMAEYGANDEPALRSMGDLFEERLRLQSTVDQAGHTIQTSVGIGAAFTAFLTSMTGLSIEHILTALNQVTREIEQLQAERDRLNQEIGSLTLKIEQLSAASQLLDLQMKQESKLEQLCRAASDWARSQIALTMLNAAVARYEDTRQPDVIQSAERAFSAITGGAYTRVRKPFQQPELEVLDSMSAVRKVSELSRGTVEQLYFAMRLGLIENYEQHAERMPVIMDDVLVNFDDERAILAAQAISAFAANRQVIAMTCHGSSRDYLLRAGGNPVPF